MQNGAELVDRIDELLKARNLKRQALCDTVGISLQGITNWKTKNSMPLADTVVKIAEFFGVSVEYLVTGSIPYSFDTDLEPKAVVSRILELLKEKTGIHDWEENDALYLPLKGVVSKETLINWSNNRCLPDTQTLWNISSVLKVQFQFLVTGTNVLEYDYDSHTMELARQYDSLIKSFDCLYDSDRHIVEKLVSRLFKLRRQIEGTDYDFDAPEGSPWNKQADPN
jgi:transcriptional regulator with XRE-family HTH domain